MNYIEATEIVKNIEAGQQVSYDVLAEAATLFRQRYESAKTTASAKLDVQHDITLEYTTKVRVRDESNNEYAVKLTSSYAPTYEDIQKIVDEITWNTKYLKMEGGAFWREVELRDFMAGISDKRRN